MITKIHIYILQESHEKKPDKEKIFFWCYIKIVNKLFLLIAVYLKICSEFNSDLSL